MVILVIYEKLAYVQAEALIFALTNPQYDDRFFIELQVPCHLRKTYLGKGQLNSE